MLIAVGTAFATGVSADVTGAGSGDSEALGQAPAARRLAAEMDRRSVERQKSILPAPSRAQVAALYNQNYLAGLNMPAMNWTGDVAACNPGSVSLAYQQSMIDRVNVFRAVARLSPVALYPSTQDKDERVAAAALLMAANSALSHNPPSTWTCYGTAFAGSTVGALGGGGAGGAGNSNIGWSSSNLYATNAVIDAYMVDSGTGNTAVGHRTGMLDAKQTLMAVGVTPAGANNGAANALWWIDFGTRTASSPTPEGVAWPPNGFIPYQLLPAASNRWSFQYPGADFSGATVTMSSGGASYGPLAYDFRSTGCPIGFTCLPDDAIVWRPPLDVSGVNGVTYASPGAVDKSYTVNITGVAGAGVPSSFAYVVTVIDPSISPAVSISGTITGGSSGVAGVTFCARPSTGVTCSVSNAAGAYDCVVPNGWSGTLHSPMVAGWRIPAQGFSSVTTAITRNVVATSGIPSCDLDVDNNGLFEPATDGAAIVRRLLGLPVDAFSGLAGNCAANTSGAAIYNAVDTSYVAGGYNVVGGSATLPLLDGAVILRAMNGQTGVNASSGLGLTGKPGALRTSWATIQPWLNSNCRASF